MQNIKHYCGVYATTNNNTNYDTSYVINGLKLLQHRGRECAGICYIKDKHYLHKDVGTVDEVFSDFPHSSFKTCIGHVRYSTTDDEPTRCQTAGNNELVNQEMKKAQPMQSNEPQHAQDGDNSKLKFSIAHNGNIPNIKKFKKEMNIITETNSDTEIMVKYIELLLETNTIDETLIKFIERIPGAYALVLQFDDALYCMRDSYGIRPLCIGKIYNQLETSSFETSSFETSSFETSSFETSSFETSSFETSSFETSSFETSYCISSESCALQDHKLIRDVKPGEIIKINTTRGVCVEDSKFQTIYRKVNKPSFCSLEIIYFMKPDSVIYDTKIDDIRYSMGHDFGKEETSKLVDTKQVHNAIVVGIPNSGISSGKGFADAVGLPYRQLVSKDANVNRSFILPNNQDRIETCQKKFIYSDELKGKIVYVVDDSMVRGNTMISIINSIYDKGAIEVHIRITAPPLRHPCYYGIDIPTYEELIAHNRTAEEIKDILGCESLRYMDVKLLKKVLWDYKINICTSCFDGEYNKELLDW
jgi:amidophosphoribosyltransferase